jgi:hypothetical protein
MCYDASINHHVGRDREEVTKHPQPEAQIQDRTLKSLFGDEADQIVPRLLPGSQLLGERNIEIDRSTLKADLVYNMFYRGEPHLLNLELQISADSDMPKRMVRYHCELHTQSGLPVISMILYPFETTVPVPPYIEKSGDRTVMMVDYQVLTVWKWDAREFVRDHVACLYPLLPAMKGVTMPLIREALREMDQHFPEEVLRRHLTRFYHVLYRSTMLTEQEKGQVKEIMDTTYGRDWFIEKLPEVVDLVEKGRAEGEIKGELRDAQRMLVKVVEARFPALVVQAQERAECTGNATELDNLIVEIIKAPDEAAAQRLLVEYGRE